MVGEEPELPPRPVLLCGDPTFEGLVRLLKEGHGYAGLFSSEGGLFVGGHGMNLESRLRTVAGLSSMWDGLPIKRTRAAEGVYDLAGRRVALHLLIQPRVADMLFADKLLVDQGIMSRILAAMPNPRGFSPWQEPDPADLSQISQFSHRAIFILKECKPRSSAGDMRELMPRRVKFSTGAASAWIEFHDEIEARLNRDLESIRHLAAKAPEHAARLAASMEGFRKIDVEELSEQAMSDGITLMRHYLGEGERIYAAILDSPDLKLAQAALDWLDKHWKEPAFALKHLYQFGPHNIRQANTSRRIVNILEEHGWVELVEGCTSIKGELVREAYDLAPLRNARTASSSLSGKAPANLANAGEPEDPSKEPRPLANSAKVANPTEKLASLAIEESTAGTSGGLAQSHSGGPGTNDEEVFK